MGIREGKYVIIIYAIIQIYSTKSFKMIIPRLSQRDYF